MTRFQHWLECKRRFDIECKMGNTKKAAIAYAELKRANCRLFGAHDEPEDATVGSNRNA